MTPDAGQQPIGAAIAALLEMGMDYSVEVERHYEVRGWYSAVHNIRHDGGDTGDSLVKVAVGVVIRNPYAGKFVADLSE